MPLNCAAAYVRFPPHQSYKGTGQDKDVRGITGLKCFHFVPFSLKGRPRAIKILGKLVGYIKLGQCDIVNRHFTSTLLASVKVSYWL